MTAGSNQQISNDRTISPDGKAQESQGQQEPVIIDIPPDVGVQCPAQDNAIVPLKTCEGCGFCNGLTEAYLNKELHFSRQYMVCCAYPIDRELVKISGFSEAGSK